MGKGVPPKITITLASVSNIQVHRCEPDLFCFECIVKICGIYEEEVPAHCRDQFYIRAYREKCFGESCSDCSRVGLRQEVGRHYVDFNNLYNDKPKVFKTEFGFEFLQDYCYYYKKQMPNSERLGFTVFISTPATGRRLHFIFKREGCKVLLDEIQGLKVIGALKWKRKKKIGKVYGVVLFTKGDAPVPIQIKKIYGNWYKVYVWGMIAHGVYNTNEEKEEEFNFEIETAKIGLFDAYTILLKYDGGIEANKYGIWYCNVKIENGEVVASSAPKGCLVYAINNGMLLDVKKYPKALSV